MLKAITTVAAGLLLALSSQPLMAVGFGRLVNATSLGQALDVSVALDADITEQVTSDCVSAEVVVGDSVLPRPVVRVRLEPAGNASTRSLRVTTTVRIHEPIVQVTVAAACPSRVSRQFVVLIDPPLTASEPALAAAEPPAVATPPASPATSVSVGALPDPGFAQGISDAAAGSGVLAPPPAPAPPASARRATRSTSKGVASGAKAARRAQAATPRKARRASVNQARARSSPRLELERGAGPLAAAAASAPLAVAGVLPVALAASAAASSPAESVAELQREAIQSLQQRLDKLQADSEASSRSIADLQARLRAAESSRSTGWLSYALAAAGAALLLWFGQMIGRRAAARRPGTPWWKAEADAAAAKPVDAEDRASARPAFVQSALASLPEAIELPDEVLPTTPAPLVVPDHSRLPEPLRPVQVFGDTVASVGTALAVEPPVAPASALTADELIDLEQQAEFFVALGQDDSAVDLLNAFLRGGGGASPLPYLKLLEIHRRREERDAYERIRDRHARRFGTEAPKWEDQTAAAVLADGQSPVMRQIESVWADPPEAMKLIESLLVSSDPAAAPLDLAALTDLQFLYLLARAVREFEDQPAQPSAESTVDLLLPLSHQDEHRSVVASVDSGFSTPSDIDLELDFLPPRNDPKPLA
ncbi:MAG TPA: hypothetical protein PKV56_08535 [Burkholderiaceae bacterium]|nr:hypothetical protein [Burkholderiaceae bacterium]